MASDQQLLLGCAVAALRSRRGQSAVERRVRDLPPRVGSGAYHAIRVARLALSRALELSSGVGFLEKGGSYVTRISEDFSDFSIVIEKMGWRDSPCARPNNRSSPFYEAEMEDVVLVLGGVQIQKHTRRLYVWRSNLTEGAPEDQVFQQLEPILVDSQQPQIRLTVRVNEIYTVTTLPHAQADAREQAGEGHGTAAAFKLPRQLRLSRPGRLARGGELRHALGPAMRLAS